MLVAPAHHTSCFVVERVVLNALPNWLRPCRRIFGLRRVFSSSSEKPIHLNGCEWIDDRASLLRYRVCGHKPYFRTLRLSMTQVGRWNALSSMRCLTGCGPAAEYLAFGDLSHRLQRSRSHLCDSVCLLLCACASHVQVERLVLNALPKWLRLRRRIIGLRRLCHRLRRSRSTFASQ